MAEVTNAMLYQAALKLKAQTESLLEDCDDCSAQIRAIETCLSAARCDTRNIYAILLRQDATLTRIERRLGIGEMTA